MLGATKHAGVPDILYAMRVHNAFFFVLQQPLKSEGIIRSSVYHNSFMPGGKGNEVICRISNSRMLPPSLL